MWAEQWRAAMGGVSAWVSWSDGHVGLTYLSGCFLTVKRSQARAATTKSVMENVCWRECLAFYQHGIRCPLIGAAQWWRRCWTCEVSAVSPGTDGNVNAGQGTGARAWPSAVRGGKRHTVKHKHRGPTLAWVAWVGYSANAGEYRPRRPTTDRLNHPPYPAPVCTPRSTGTSTRALPAVTYELTPLHLSSKPR